jgi:hypothetical protein
MDRHKPFLKLATGTHRGTQTVETEISSTYPPCEVRKRLALRMKQFMLWSDPNRSCESEKPGVATPDASAGPRDKIENTGSPEKKT